MTRQEYEQAVALVARRNPGETLLNTLRAGYRPVNEIYLRAALRRLPPVGLKTEGIAGEERDTQRDRRGADAQLRELWGERTRLFGEMNKRSNHFHECRSDDERAANSREIRRIWSQILDVKERIAHYEDHGELPEPVSEERFPLPDDPVALMKKLNSIRAQISQVKKRLDDLGALPQDDPDRSKIGDAEARLAELKLYAGHAEKAIERASVHAG